MTSVEHRDDAPPDLDELLEDCWQRLVHGAGRARHAFHTGVLGSVGDDGPEVRTVVLRHASPDERRLICHTDARSAKCVELRARPRVGWLFYDARHKIQLRIRGCATVHAGDTPARERWNGSPPRARRCYGVEPAPGTALPAAGSGLPEELLSRSPTLEESAAWADRFAVVSAEVDCIEWLQLRARGHLRARFEWDGESWRSTWLVP